MKLGFPDARNISRELKDRIFERDGHKCLCCGSTENLTIDHIKAVYFGGTKAEYNLQTLCHDCNQNKGRKTIDYRPIKINITGFVDLSSIKYRKKSLSIKERLEYYKQENKELKSKIAYLSNMISRLPRVVKWIFNISYEEEDKSSHNP